MTKDVLASKKKAFHCFQLFYCEDDVRTEHPISYRCELCARERVGVQFRWRTGAGLQCRLIASFAPH